MHEPEYPELQLPAELPEAVAGRLQLLFVVTVQEAGGVNVAETVHAPVIAPVVYVVPESEPLHPETDAVYPAFGVTVKVVVLPEVTVCEAGEMVPPVPAVVETV